MNGSQEKPWLFWLWNAGFVVLSAMGIGVLSLLLAYGEYSWGVFTGYFTHPLILLLNLLPVVLLMLLCWFATGRAWVAFLLTAAVILGGSVGSYFKLMFRDDPFVFADISSISTAMGVAGNYALAMDKRLWCVVLCVAAGAVFLFFLVQGKPSGKVRAVGAALALLCVFPLWKGVYASDDVYERKTRNFEYINQWSATQNYISRGFVYPFLHSIKAAIDTPPEGYSETGAVGYLARFQDADIPDGRRVNLLCFQLEGFNDFTRLGIQGIDESVYRAYHQIEAEGYAGDLVTNIFAGGTIDTERCFLTGYYRLRDFRKNTNSYVWYLRDQGYQTAGSHPCYDWFYNRRNIMPWLGFQEYVFLEDHYAALSGGDIAYDDVMLPEALRLYREKAQNGPVFDFHITYQGHGPYNTDAVEWGGGAWDPAGFYDVSEYDFNVMNNYLGSVRDTGERLLALLDALREDETPVVVVLYGDHNPWLGDGASVYADLGVNLDTHTEDGFFNYYSTRYVFWANHAAKMVLDNDFSGEGPRLSANYLMDELFVQLGWTGNAYMQLTREVREVLPVVTSNGYYVENGALKQELSLQGSQVLSMLDCAQYYMRRNFKYAM